MDTWERGKSFAGSQAAGRREESHARSRRVEGTGIHLSRSSDDSSLSFFFFSETTGICAKAKGEAGQLSKELQDRCEQDSRAHGFGHRSSTSLIVITNTIIYIYSTKVGISVCFLESSKEMTSNWKLNRNTNHNSLINNTRSKIQATQNEQLFTS